MLVYFARYAFCFGDHLDFDRDMNFSIMNVFYQNQELSLRRNVIRALPHEGSQGNVPHIPSHSSSGHSCTQDSS